MSLTYEDEEYDEYNEHLQLEGKIVHSVKHNSGVYGRSNFKIKFNDGSWVSFSYGRNNTHPILYIKNNKKYKKNKRK